MSTKSNWFAVSPRSKVSTARVSGWVQEEPLSPNDTSLSHLLTEMVLTPALLKQVVLTRGLRLENKPANLQASPALL